LQSAHRSPPPPPGRGGAPCCGAGVVLEGRAGAGMGQFWSALQQEAGLAPLAAQGRAPQPAALSQTHLWLCGGAYMCGGAIGYRKQEPGAGGAVNKPARRRRQAERGEHSGSALKTQTQPAPRAAGGPRGRPLGCTSDRSGSMAISEAVFCHLGAPAPPGTSPRRFLPNWLPGGLLHRAARANPRCYMLYELKFFPIPGVFFFQHRLYLVH
jgi:hypothetical protein